jgi:hypothetical protein
VIQARWNRNTQSKTAQTGFGVSASPGIVLGAVLVLVLMSTVGTVPLLTGLAVLGAVLTLGLGLGLFLLERDYRRRSVERTEVEIELSGYEPVEMRSPRRAPSNPLNAAYGIRVVAPGEPSQTVSVRNRFE